MSKDKLSKVDALLKGGDVDPLGRVDDLLGETTHIKLPQKVYKPIDRLSRGLKVIKKLKGKADGKANK